MTARCRSSSTALLRRCSPRGVRWSRVVGASVRLAALAPVARGKVFAGRCSSRAAEAGSRSIRSSNVGGLRSSSAARTIPPAALLGRGAVCGHLDRRRQEVAGERTAGGHPSAPQVSTRRTLGSQPLEPPAFPSATRPCERLPPGGFPLLLQLWLVRTSSAEVGRRGEVHAIDGPIGGPG